MDNPDKTPQIVNTVKKYFPHLQIMARASGRQDAYDLIWADVKHIYRETLDSSIRMRRESAASQKNRDRGWNLESLREEALNRPL